MTKKTNNTEERSYTFKSIAIDKIEATGNIRKFKDVSDLKASIKAHGIINPVTVVAKGDGTFKLIAGFRRHLAATELGLDKMPCHVIDGSDKAIAEIPLSENITRMDMTPYEECLAVQHLVTAKNNVKQIARKFGRSVRWALVRKKIAEAGEKVMEKVNDGKIQLGAAAKLADLPDEDFKKELEDCVKLDNDTADYILTRYHLDLDKAPFDKKKCMKCPKCSASQCDLFSDEPKAYCLDPECYAKKVKEHAHAIVKDLNKSGIKATIGLLLSYGTGMNWNDPNADYWIRDYKKELLEQAEKEGIKKRVIVDEETCKTFEYYDKRDLSDFHEETEEETAERLEKERVYNEMNSARLDLFKDRLSKAIALECTKSAYALAVTLFWNLDDKEEILSDEAKERLGMTKDKDGYFKENLNDIADKLDVGKVVAAITMSADNLDYEIHWNSDIMKNLYKVLTSKDPEKLAPTEKQVKAEFDRREKEAEERRKAEKLDESES